MNRLLLSTAFVVTTAATPAWAIDPPPKHFVFNVMRSGSQIGQHTVDVKTEGKVTTVEEKTNIEVKVMFVTAYKLTYTAQEVWTDGNFTSFKSQTDDNGKKHTVNVTATPAKITVSADGKTAEAPKGSIPASFWNTQFTTRQNVIHTETGQILPITVTEVPQLEQVSTAAGPKPAKHYKLTGGLERDLWFDQTGAPVRFQLKGSDNSIITSEAQQ